MLRTQSLFLAIALLLGACGSLTDPGSISLQLQWEEPPTGQVWIWARVEEREDPSKVGPPLASAGPAAYVAGEPLSLSMGNVSHGKGRVVVVEIREDDDPTLRVLYYEVSAPFALQAGSNRSVDVPLVLQKPKAELFATGAVSLEFGGGAALVVGLARISNTTVVTRSTGTVEVVLANDASFSANYTVIPLDYADLECHEIEEGGATFDECRVSGWDLTAKLPVLGDGLYTVYGKFRDRYGYESEVVKASVPLDSQPPQAVVASVSPTSTAPGDTPEG